MSLYTQTLAITLKKQLHRENDCFFSFYTKEMGKVVVLATGAKKIKSKLVGHLEPFGICQISIAQGYFTPRLTASNLVKRYNNVSTNLELIEVAGKCLNLVEKLTKENHRDEKVYELLVAVLETLEQKLVTEKLKVIYPVFVLKLLTLLGYKPWLYQCLKCKTKIKPNDNLFSYEKGGLLCGQCKKGQEGTAVSPEVIKLLRAAIDMNFNEFLKIRATEKIIQDFNNLTHYFLEFRYSS